MEIIALGAGQDIGKSCIIATIYDKTIMFDCGMHIGYNDFRRFPDFSYLSKTNNFDHIIDFIIISHFHLDHCGALPYFTEVLGYKGPIYMTYPTKAVLPILLKDYRKILQMKSKENNVFSLEQINDCIKKIIPLNINETYEHSEDFYIKPYYAGHVIGAAMFYVKYKNESIVYTGDYSTISDQHLRAAQIDCLRPNLLITESTYGSVIKDCRKSKEREFLQIIQKTIDRGGKVLIPIFALGRAQELCLLLDSYWDRMGLSVPIFFSGDLNKKSNEIYRRFINFTNEKIKSKIEQKNVFEFKKIKNYNKKVLNINGPCVIFSSPAMLHSGNSLQIFKDLCEDAKNTVILPGYCIRGTIGEKILNGVKTVNIYGNSMNVNLEIHEITFSAHADTIGIMKIIDQLKPKNIMLVHGEKIRMKNLKNKINSEYKNINVFYPPNGVLFQVPIEKDIIFKINKKLVEKNLLINNNNQNIELAVKIKKEKDEYFIEECKNIKISKKN